jgi:hypothetical protein
MLSEAVAKSRHLVHPVPQLLAIERILANQQLLYRPFHRRLVTAQHMPSDPFVGGDPGNRDGALGFLGIEPDAVAPARTRSAALVHRATMNNFDIGDFHISSLYELVSWR